VRRIIHLASVLRGVLHFSRPKGVEMPLIHIVLVLIVVGVLLWLINSFIPMDSKIKSILNIVVVIAVIIWLLQAFGVMGPISRVRVK
jgi:undecaprenyl pyrophosphate phosphatase UppP